MTSETKPIIKYVLYILSVTLVLFAIAVTGARLLLPRISSYHSEIQQKVSQVVGQPITFSKIDTHWRGLTPMLQLHDVALLDVNGQKTLQEFERAYVSIDALASLINASVKLRDVAVVGGDIHIRQLRDGSVLVRGMRLAEDLTEAGEEGTDLTEALQNVTLSLLSSRVRFESSTLGVDYQLDSVNLSVVSRKGRHLLSLDTDLPNQLGKHLTLRLRVEGKLKNHRVGKGQPIWNSRA